MSFIIELAIDDDKLQKNLNRSRASTKKFRHRRPWKEAIALKSDQRIRRKVMELNL